MPSDIDDLAVVEQSVQDCSGNNRVSEEFLPVPKALVGSDDGRTAFIPVGDKLKKEGFLDVFCGFDIWWYQIHRKQYEVIWDEWA